MKQNCFFYDKKHFSQSVNKHYTYYVPGNLLYWGYKKEAKDSTCPEGTDNLMGETSQQICTSEIYVYIHTHTPNCGECKGERERIGCQDWKGF